MDRRKTRNTLPLQESRLRSANALHTLATLPSVSSEQLEGEVQLTLDKMKLIYFAPTSEPGAKPPLLICYALVNRPYIVDLEPDRSLLRDLLAQGHPVYLIDWGYPDLTDAHLGLEDYILDYLDTAIETALRHSDRSKIALLGICQGGVFSLCYAALKPERIAQLITLVTPIDAHAKGFTLAQMVREVNVAQITQLKGNLPGSLLNQVYQSLKPLQLGIFKQLHLADNLSEAKRAQSYLRMEHWINDSPDLAGKAACEFAEQFFRKNGLMNRTFEISGQTARIDQLKAPVLNIFGTKDHLVPPESSRQLGSLLPKTLNYRELPLEGGHIGAFVSDRNRKFAVQGISEWISD